MKKIISSQKNRQKTETRALCSQTTFLKKHEILFSKLFSATFFWTFIFVHFSVGQKSFEIAFFARALSCFGPFIILAAKRLKAARYHHKKN
jgi:hypothetical protein